MNDGVSVCVCVCHNNTFCVVLCLKRRKEGNGKKRKGMEEEGEPLGSADGFELELFFLNSPCVGRWCLGGGCGLCFGRGGGGLLRDSNEITVKHCALQH